MLILAKILAVVTMVWFYLTAKEKKQKPITWAVIGLIGYALSWALVYYGIVVPFLPPTTSQSTSGGFFVTQIPALAGFFAVYIIRGKLIHDADAEANE